MLNFAILESLNWEANVYRPIIVLGRAGVPDLVYKRGIMQFVVLTKLH